MGRERILTVAALLIVLVAAFAARCLNYREVFTSRGVLLYGIDSYYHTRRSVLTALDYPHVPRFDYYSGFPRGMESHFAPLWDILSASVALTDYWLLGESTHRQSIHSAEIRNPYLEASVREWSTLLPPIFGALTAALVYLIARQLVPPFLSLLAALLLAFSPAHVDYTLLGRPDHHVLESFLSTLAIFLFLSILNCKGSSGAVTMHSCALGLTFALALLSSVQCLLFVALIALYTYLEVFFRDSELGVGLANTLLTSLLFSLFFFSAGTLLTLPQYLFQFHYDRPSLYQLGVLMSLMLPLLWLRLWTRQRLTSRQFSLYLTAAVAWVVLLVALLAPTLRGLSFIGRDRAWISDVQDAYPLIFVGDNLNLVWPSGQLGLAWLGLPLWMVLVLSSSRMNGKGQQFTVFWAGFTFLLCLYQVRFVYFFSAALCCVLVLALERLRLSILGAVIRLAPTTRRAASTFGPRATRPGSAHPAGRRPALSCGHDPFVTHGSC